MTPEQCPIHAAIEARLKSGESEFAEMKDDIKTIKAAVTGNLTTGKPGYEQRISAMESVVQNVNKAAWAIGVPIVLAAIFGVYNIIKTMWEKVTP